ncbi:acyl carrier protein [Pedomonas sp. V897]|uniref:acyl carrier protein n=1 Tax=Pedomonas sp. V897 TaxID=3446482 RepID=UPI003EE1CB23
MLSHQQIYEVLTRLIAPFNKKGVALTPDTSFASDLEFDSLTVMDLVAAIEDEFDITLPLNMLPDLETIGHVASAVEKILKDRANG